MWLAWVLLTSVSIAGDDDLRAALRGSAPHRLAKHLLGHVLFVFALVQASKPLTALADGNDADSGEPAPSLALALVCAVGLVDYAITTQVLHHDADFHEDSADVGLDYRYPPLFAMVARTL